MADSDKNILITPSVGSTSEPTIVFTGGDNNPVTLRILDDGTLSFEGSSGQLFSVTDSLTGTIFSVNDISGIPSLEIEDDGTVSIAEFAGNVGIGTSAPASKLDVVGDIAVSGTVDGRDVAVDGTKLDGIAAGAEVNTVDSVNSQTGAVVLDADDIDDTSTTNKFTNAADISKLAGIESGATADQTASEILTAIKTVDGSGSGLDSDLLDGQQGSYYLNTSTSFGGDVSGTYNNIIIADDSHNHIISNVDGLQTALDAKAPLASPGLTGTPTAPTATSGTNTTQIATTAFVGTAVANLVDSAPATLDTLNELAAALGDDPNFATTVTNSIATKLPLAGGTMTGNITFSGAQTVDGRDLSVDGAKLDGIEAGATADQTASEILTAIKTVDGSGTGLDADLLDGQEGTYYRDASNLNAGTVNSARVSGSYTGITGTGALNAGSITSGFGNIDNGSSSITTGSLTSGTSSSSTSLVVESGDNATSTFGGKQIIFGYGGTANYSHNIRTRHHAGQDAQNAIDFYVWDFGTDASGTAGTKHVLSIEGSDTGRVGIGTKTPTEVLDVQGNTIVSGTVKASDGVITLTTAGAPSSSIADGALAIDTTNDKLYIRSGSSWVEVAGGGGGSSVTTSDTPPSSPSAGDLWYESDTGSFYIYYDSFWVSISGTVPSATVISDADGDTKVQVEESPDEDVIRFDTAGVQRAFINSSGLDVNGSISVSGTVDGRDIATDGSKLDGIESGADVTDSINVAGSIENIALTSITGDTGDKFLVIDDTDGGLKAVLWENAVRDSLILSHMNY